VPSLLVTAGPAAAQAGPARLVLATVTRRNEWSPLARLKSLNYLDNILARQEAAACGADDAVLLNTAGRVAETSIANLFAVLDDALVTPPVADGALPGILRGLVIERLGAVARPLDPEDLTRARAIVLTNSLGARPVASLPGWQPDPTAPDLARHILETCR
jgi:branched-chain amino acid aminotransferase